MLRRINRSVLLLLMLLATGGGFFLYHEHNNPEQQLLRKQEAEMAAVRQHDAEATKRAEEAEAARKLAEIKMHRLLGSQRVAEIIVRDPVYSESASGGVAGEWLVFTEVDADGNELSSREFWIEGRRAHIDAEVIKFDGKFVEENDALKGKSVALFTKLYDQLTSPNRAKEIDKEGEVPAVYRSTDPEVTKFQQAIWGQFWRLADDPDYRAKMGVRVAQGEGVWRDFDFGYKYKITVDANGGVNIVNEKLPAGVINALKNHQKNATPAAPTTNISAAP